MPITDGETVPAAADDAARPVGGRVGVAYPLLVLAWRILPGGALLGFASGIAGGVVALVAIVRRGERAPLVVAAVAPLVLVAAFVLAELLVGHD